MASTYFLECPCLSSVFDDKGKQIESVEIVKKKILLLLLLPTSWAYLTQPLLFLFLSFFHSFPLSSPIDLSAPFFAIFPSSWLSWSLAFAAAVFPRPFYTIYCEYTWVSRTGWMRGSLEEEKKKTMSNLFRKKTRLKKLHFFLRFRGLPPSVYR